jgi:dihydropyrimidinase
LIVTLDAPTVADYDLVVRGGTVVTASDAYRADVGIIGERIAAVGENLKGERSVDAGGLLVMPGGVDTHCHIAQLRPEGGTDEESFTTGSAAALLGGTTTAISFSTQFKGQPIRDTLNEYRELARASAIDYSFHQIISDPTDEVLAEIPGLVEAGIRSLKVFLTYDTVHLDDRQYLQVLSVARRTGALVTVHCENYDAIDWRARALLADGRTAPKYHAWSRPEIVEREATYRAIALAELVDQPIQIFHVSSAGVAKEIARAQARGVKVWAETCPQYLTLTAADMDRPGFEGAKYMCSPSPRDVQAQEGLWDTIRRGTIDVVSSDHSGFSYHGDLGKRSNGEDAPFTNIPNGLPGLATRLPLLFSEGVAKGRIDVTDFVRLVASQPARIFGLTRKGRIAPGADADILLWDPTRKVKITNDKLGHAIDHTPYEGMEVTGWAEAVFLRGQLAMQSGKVVAAPGSGKFLARDAYDLIKPTGRLADGFDAAAMAVGPSGKRLV